ncbi:facilitated trehalose transporter Tret1 [Procambarus clarkii]|uniref:facilitated trehalose transporter Tret1 n=1 Tax=Procambarus clarkii TaxID=6728 RepID=UPI001E675B99|nr:facilitated trehalose transporter Tret1-like [Procambarus clarkii]
MMESKELSDECSTQNHLPAGGAVEDKRTRRRRLFLQGFKIFTVSLAMWFMGSVFVFPSVVAEDLSRHNTTLYGNTLALTPTQMDMMGSVVSLGSLLGAWIFASLMMRLGRRLAMIIAGIIAFLGWLGVALLPNFAGIIVGRALTGVAIGGFSVTVIAYGIEMADMEVRGIMSMIINLGVPCGQVVTASVGYDARYYVVAFINILLPLFFILGLAWMPESPSFLVIKGREAEARDILRSLRSKHADVEAEIQNYREMNIMSGEGTWKGLLQPEILKSILITSILFIFAYFTGYLVINANASRIFADADSSIDNRLCTIIILLVQVAGGACSVLLIDKLGRRKTLILSFCLMCVSLTGMAIYEGLVQNDEGGDGGTVTDSVLEGLDQEDPGPSRPNGWIPLVCLMVSQAGVAAGVNPIPFTLSHEYFPTWIRSQAASIPFSVSTVASFGSLQLYTPMRKGFTQAGLYGFYAAVSALGVLFTSFFIRETMGKKVG